MRIVPHTCIHVLVTQRKPVVVLLQTLHMVLQVWAGEQASLAKLQMTNWVVCSAPTWTKLALAFIRVQRVQPSQLVVALLR